MAARNYVSKKSVQQKWFFSKNGGKRLHFFLPMFDTQEGLSRESRHLTSTAFAKEYHQALKPKYIGPWDATDIAKCRVKHHPFRHCLSRIFMSDDDLQCINAPCTVYCTVEDFNVDFANLDLKSERYRTGLCAWYHVQKRSVPDQETAPWTGAKCTRNEL